MQIKRRYLVTVALLAILAVVFGLAGTVLPVPDLASSQQSSSSSDSGGHFQNPPTYDSGWVNITDKCGQYFTLNHDLNTTEVVVDITGKQSLSPKGGALAWSRTYGGAEWDRARAVVQTNDGGYVMVGHTNSSGAGDNDSWLIKTDASGNVQWSRTYGGADDDQASAVVQTPDGGYALAGYTESYDAGYGDFWLVKTDMHGNVQWDKTYGSGLGGEGAYGVVRTSDGGYALAGLQQIYPALSDFWLVKTDANGNMQWNRTYDNRGREDVLAGGVVQTSDGGYALAGYSGSLMLDDVADFWLVKTDADGEAQWNRTYGGANWDFGYGVIQTNDGGYALAGGTRPDPDPLSHAVLLVKTDQAGNMVWNRTYGGAVHDHAFSVIQTSDGGYTMAGFTSADPGEVYPYADVLLVRTDSVGTAIWNRTYGGAQDDCAYAVVQTGDGGYALVGFTKSFGSGGYDFWLIKVDGAMNLEHQRHLGGTAAVPGWSKTYGGIDPDIGYSMIQTGDGGYAIAGLTFSYGAGGYDFWLVKTDVDGNMVWSRTYGGADDDIAYSLVQTLDGGYAMAGATMGGVGVGDEFYLVKTDATGTMQWNKTYGGTNADVASALVQTLDGGYALAGITVSYGPSADFWLVKTDSAGNMLWDKTYGGADNDYAESMIQTLDGGYAVAGWTSYNSADHDFWLVKTDESGTMQWNKTYGGPAIDQLHSVVQTLDGGYAIAGETYSYGAGKYTALGWSLINHNFWLIKTDAFGNTQWSRIYGGIEHDRPLSVIQTDDGGIAVAGQTWSHGAGSSDVWLVKTDMETGLARTGLTDQTITLYRGRTDPHWNYVRVRIWIIQEPTWMFGDINQDGIVDAQDLWILSQNYGKTFSLLSLTGILAVAGIHQYQKRKHPT